MNRNLLVVLLAIVLMPLGLVGWLGVRLAVRERESADERLRELMRSTLRSLDGEIRAVVDDRRRTVLDTLAGVAPVEELGERARRIPEVRQAFALDPRGTLIHPSLFDALSADEEEFLRRTRDLWTGGHLVPGTGRGSAPREAFLEAEVDEGASGWHVWFWGDGLHLIYWWREDDGRVVGAELDRVRLLSDVIAVLPDTDPADPLLERGRIRLLDSKGSVLYQWGAYEPGAGEWPMERLDLSAPLAAWSLEYLGTRPSLGVSFVGLAPVIAALGVLVVALAFYFYRESSREMREASQRVTFVNQVSHELKTPLTSIRMYAELLEDELDDDQTTAREYLGVLVAESQRLSRLIRNILTFGRRERHELRLRPQRGVVDDAVAAVLEQLRPSLETHGIEARFESGAGATVDVDGDAVQQILANLLSNVEKYAAAGGRVDVATRQDGDRVTVEVADRGPGVPARERERIFRPFYRISDALTDGVTGTGIGLAIARDLARLHGGDLELIDSAEGACFRLSLRCPSSDGPAAGAGEPT